MKIPGSDGSGNKTTALQDTRVGEQHGRKLGKIAGDASTANDAKAAEGTPGKGQSDSVKVSSIGSLLGSELDPAKMKEERRKKVEELKAQIANGTYQPPLDRVAQSVSEELSIEILLGGSAKSNDTENGLL